VRSLAAELLPDPGNGGVGCTDGAIGAGSLGLSEHSAAAVDQAGAKVGEIKSDEVVGSRHEPCDRCKDGGNAVMQGRT
jgi:hypothetical protein